MSPPITQHLDHLVTPTQSTWRHLARCHFYFWSHLKSCPKIIKKILKNQVTLLHHNPIKTIRVHPPGCLRKGGTWRNAIALLTAISIAHQRRSYERVWWILQGTWLAPWGKCEPNSNDMNPTLRWTQLPREEHDDGVGNPAMEVPGEMLKRVMGVRLNHHTPVARLFYRGAKWVM